MASGLNAQEILAMALAIERQGVAFYIRAAACFKDEALSGMFRGLAEMEAEHAQTFQKMLDGEVLVEGDLSGFDPDDLALRYLTAMTEGRVFPDPRRADATPITGDETPREILHRAIGAEKDSIVFYTGLRDLVKGPAAKTAIEDIIREEMGHIVLLNDRLSGLDRA